LGDWNKELAVLQAFGDVITREYICRSIEKSCADNATIATPLRMLEVFTAITLADDTRTQLTSFLLLHVVNTGL
jgi:hypothetical protein